MGTTLICSHKKSRRLFQQSIDSFCSNGDRPNLNKQRSVPGSCYKIYTPINVMFARAVSFCRFSFFMKNKIPLYQNSGKMCCLNQGLSLFYIKTLLKQGQTSRFEGKFCLIPCLVLLIYFYSLFFTCRMIKKLI